MVDKKYCMSSYLAFRYIEDDGKDFYESGRHRNYVPVPAEKRIPVHNAEDIDRELTKGFAKIRNHKLGILLSGGMDSAICASYMGGSDAYTFRFLNAGFQQEELRRAEYYAAYYGLRLHYVDINWDTVEQYVDIVMKEKAAPVHSIEPQIFQAALQAKQDGIGLMVVGESSDLIFGGMNQLIGQDWSFDDFVERYTFTDPVQVLAEPESMRYLYERYRLPGNKIDYLKFMDEVFSIESSGSYMNAFAAAGMSYYDPYAGLVMADGLDLGRIRNGEPKYLIRELMAKKYPEIPVPSKIPMPRPVDQYFADWKGPGRHEFRKDIDMDKFTGNQKWQMWCLERFLNMHEPMGDAGK
ncbi:MAG: asparagine synthase-related protein [Eubacterium sp.]|nr:asparagine synthase-related protein [Eubacterium sp.]